MSHKTTSGVGCPCLVVPSNYPIWKLRIISALKIAQVYDVVLQDAHKIILKQKLSGSTTVFECNAVKARDTKAHYIISKHLSCPIRSAAGGFNTRKVSAYTLFNEVVRIHETVDVTANAFRTFTDLCNATWDGDYTSLNTHLATMQSCRNYLEALGKKVDDEMLAFILLGSLPTGGVWDAFKSGVFGNLAPDARLGFEDISGRIVTYAMNLESMG